MSKAYDSERTPKPRTMGSIRITQAQFKFVQERLNQRQCSWGELVRWYLNRDHATVERAKR